MRKRRRRATTRMAATFALSLSGVIVALAARSTTACGGGDPAQPTVPIDLSESSTTPPPTTDPDGSNPDGDLPPLESYCQGIVFYASLDTGAFTPEVGTSLPYPYGTTAPSTAGRFGGSVALFADSGGAGPSDSGASLYFIRPDGGAPVLDDDVGTVSLWYRGIALDDIAGGGSAPVLFRPVATIAPDPVVSTGLVLVAIGDRFGLVNSPPTGPTQQLLTFTKARVRPYLRDGEFNHFAAAWRRGDAGGMPTAIMALNGGTGMVYDASFDASYEDASPNDAGDLFVPYRGYTTRNWNIPDASPSLALRLGGTMQSAPQGEIDDVAVWNRVLTFEEVDGIYKAAKPLHEQCRLK